jgi:hypothetical protein
VAAIRSVGCRGFRLNGERTSGESGDCSGPCDVPNVVVITNSSGAAWLGNIDKIEQYRRLLEWAVRCRDAGERLVLRSGFHRCRLSPLVLRT